jgi:ureidoglycolate amidohydrolase
MSHAQKAVKVDIDRVMTGLDRLARLSDAPFPAVTRVVFSEADLAARALIKEFCAEAGLTIRDDPIGNIFARWEGAQPRLPAVGTGSHIDAIPHAGRFDGTVGVIGGLEAINALRRAGYQPERPIELVVFTSEEPTRFGVGCFGSRALSGSLSAGALAALADSDGRSIDDLRQSAGFSGELADVRLGDGYFSSFVELHIEQGPLLEQANTPIGVVTAIAAPAALRFHFEGEGGHAGAVLMPGRKDALCAAAEAVLAVEASAHATGSNDTVATTGVCRVHPGAINSIPDRVTLEVDVRDIELARRDGVVSAIQAAILEIAHKRRIVARVECLNADPPATMAPQVVAAINDACETLGVHRLSVISRAYHDSLFIARIAPTGMIFIPSRNGISHRPDEYSAPEAIACGVEVLALTLARLATDRGCAPGRGS